MKEVQINSNHIQLDQFLKWANIVASGGEAKSLIQSAAVKVNGEIETRRGKKLVAGDIVELEEMEIMLKVIKN